MKEHDDKGKGNTRRKGNKEDRGKKRKAYISALVGAEISNICRNQWSVNRCNDTGSGI
jgi:hypothetical protein